LWSCGGHNGSAGDAGGGVVTTWWSPSKKESVRKRVALV